MSELHIYFDSKHVSHDRAYLVIPRSRLENISTNCICTESAYPGEALDRLRVAVQQAFADTRGIFPSLYSRVNDLFYWHYWPLFKTLHVIVEIMKANKFESIVIHGVISKSYSAFFNKGDESQPILFFPEFFYPIYFQEALSPVYPIKIVRDVPRIVERVLLSKLRNPLILSVKVGLLMLQAIKFKMFARPQRGMPADDVAFVSRGVVNTEYADKFATQVETTGTKVTIFYDPMIRDVFRRMPTLLGQRGGRFVHAHQFLTLKNIRSVLAGALKRVSGYTRTITDGRFLITENIGRIFGEHAMSSVDVALHHLCLKQFLLQKRPKLLITNELVTPYLFAHAAAAASADIRCVTSQAFAFEPIDVVDCFPNNHLFLQSRKLLEAFRKSFPEQMSKMSYPGDLGFVEKPDRNVSAEIGAITYFTQPYEPRIHVEIINRLHVRFPRAQLMVKVHPRDDARPYQNLAGVQCYLSGQRSNAEMLATSDLVVSRCSSVLHEALAMGVPYIACTFNEHELEFNPPYLNSRMPVRVKSISELEERLGNFEEWRSRFFNARSEYIGEIFEPFDASGFLATALGLSNSQP